VTEAWIQAFLNAVTEAEQRESQATELAERQAADLLQWCLHGSDPDHGGSAGAQGSFRVSCVRCGVPIQHTPPSADDGGDYLSNLWTCGDCRGVLRSLTGQEPSPGRPPEPSPSKARIARYRLLGARMSARRSTQAPAPANPQMPASSPPRPSAPRQPQPGPWS
jgi:hypothetical protein